MIKDRNLGSVHFEKAMSVEFVLQGATSSSDSIKKVKEAFLNKYSLNIEHLHTSTYLDFGKTN